MTLRMKIIIKIDHAIGKAMARRDEANAKWHTTHSENDYADVMFQSGQVCALRNLQESLWEAEKKAIDKKREKEIRP